jgi:transcription initiation factor TFIIE subunit beta
VTRMAGALYSVPPNAGAFQPYSSHLAFTCFRTPQSKDLVCAEGCYLLSSFNFHHLHFPKAKFNVIAYYLDQCVVTCEGLFLRTWRPHCRGTQSKMSYLENQLSAFKSNLASASTKIANKRSVAAPIKSTPSPAPSQPFSAGRNDLKRKRPEPTNVVYSQPADTGTGKDIRTQVTYAIEYLKSKGSPQTLSDLLSYLSLQYSTDQYKRAINQILQKHDKVEYDPAGFGGKGSFSFRPIHNIRSGEQLLRHLQAQRTAQGLNVRELRDGWQDAEETIKELEDEGKLLVTRNKKDNHAKMVWPNDPSLAVAIDHEFQAIWHKIRLPEAGALADELERAGLTPTNKARGIKVKPKALEKKTKKPRKSGKTTNVHMVGVLRDYSHLKK